MNGIVLFAIAIIASTCPEGGVPIEAFNAALDQALVDYANLEQDAFKAGAVRTQEQLPCLSESLSTAHVAKFYRVQALEAFLRRDSEATILFFRAALAIEPDYELPSSIARPGSSLHRLFEEARRLPPSATEPVGSAIGEATLVDGEKDAPRPIEVPATLQRIGEGYVVLETSLLSPMQPLPEWALPRAPELEQSQTFFARSRSPKAFYIASGILAGISLASFGANVLVNSQFENPETPPSEFPSLQKQSIATTVASTVAGATALGTGGFAVYLTIRF